MTMWLILAYNILFQVQDMPVKVKVVDEVSLLPIPFVSYRRLSDNKGSYADADGNMVITDDKNQSYIFSCTGYLPDTIAVSNLSQKVALKPLVVELMDVKILAKRSSSKIHEIGYLGKFSLNPYFASLPRKMEIYTLIWNYQKEVKWVIRDIEMSIGANKSKIYESFVIRLFIRENNNKFPGKNLLTKDMVVNIKENTFKYTFGLQEVLLLPDNGCFVGFETVGKIDKEGKFIPFSDFYQKPEKPFQFVVKLVKSDSFSLIKYGGVNGWFNNKSSDNRPDTYAIGLNVYAQ